MCTFIKLAKAFDTVEKIDMRGTTGKLFESYLYNISQCVRVGKYISNTKTVERGVSQGSVLDPL